MISGSSIGSGDRPGSPEAIDDAVDLAETFMGGIAPSGQLTGWLAMTLLSARR
jgi:hypothetical protein